MIIRKSILSLIAIYVIIISVPAYSNDQEPIYESSDLVDAIEYTNVNVEDNILLQTPSYDHYQNARNKHSLISHRALCIYFVRMGDKNVKAYMIEGLKVNKDNIWWSVYEIHPEEDNMRTRIYKYMMKELTELFNSGCPRQREDRI